MKTSKIALLVLVLTTVCVFSQNRPRVLIIGDSIYREISRSTASALKDRAEVVFGAFASYDSTSALANFDKLLAGKKWDLIHFNFGLNDLMYKDPATKETRAMHKDVGGVRVCSPQQYEKNLRELLKRFKAHGAKVVWAATTPIVGKNSVLDIGSEVEYNRIAAKIMKEHNVPINDMHSYGVKAHKAMRKGHGKTYSYKGGLPMQLPVVNSIVKELKLAKE